MFWVIPFVMVFQELVSKLMDTNPNIGILVTNLFSNLLTKSLIALF